VVVPAVGIVIGDNDRRAPPLREVLQAVDCVDQENLFVLRVGDLRVALLLPRGLQEAHRRQVTRVRRAPEVA